MYPVCTDLAPTPLTYPRSCTYCEGSGFRVTVHVLNVPFDAVYTNMYRDDPRSCFPRKCATQRETSMKKRVKKLALTRESLRALQDNTLGEVPGAATIVTRFAATNCVPCQTWENVPLCRPS
jgi:hypothetical protein